MKKFFFFISTWQFIYASYSIIKLTLKKSNQTQNINSHQQIYFLVGIMISCKVQTSKTSIIRKPALFGDSSCHLAIKFEETSRFTHFKLQFQQISRIREVYLESILELNLLNWCDLKLSVLSFKSCFSFKFEKF